MSQPQQHFRTCHLCEALCGVVIEHQDGQILSIKGDKNDPFSQGHICPKAVALKDLHEDPDRLRQPVKRVGEGWEEISWEEALATVAREWRRVEEEHGHKSLAVYLGNPTVHTPALLLTPLLIKALGSRNNFSATSVDQLPTMLANLQLFGHQLLFPVPDLDRCQFLLIVGGNPAASNGSLMSAGNVMGRIQAIRERGGRVVVVDPRRTETAAKADEHLFIRPGSDAFFLAALAQVMLSEGRVKLGHLAGLIDGVEALGQALVAFTPEAVAGRCGIAASTIRALARDIAASPAAAVYGRMGACVQEFGGLSTWLLHVLNLLTGNLDREGGMMLARPPIDLLPLSGKGNFGKFRSRVRGLPGFSGELPAAVMAEEMLTPGRGQIRALFTHAGNPVLSTPNGAQLEQALAGLDFMVSVDLYINETTRHAHIILPPTSPLERAHCDPGFGPLMVRNGFKWSPALFPPPAGARQDWEIFLELAEKLAPSGGLLRLGHVGSMRLARKLGLNRLIDLLLRSGPYGRLQPLTQKRGSVLAKLKKVWKPAAPVLDLAALKAAPHGVDLGPLTRAFPERLWTANRRIQLLPEIYAQDLPRLQTALAAAAPEFVVIGRRHVRSNNSWLHNSHRLVKGPGRCTALVHPEDAKRLKLLAGQNVRLTSRVGQIELPVEISEAMMPGVISVPHGFGHHRPGLRMSTAQAHAGVSLNDITDEQHIDQLTGLPVLNGVPVKAVAVKLSRQQKQQLAAEA